MDLDIFKPNFTPIRVISYKIEFLSSLKNIFREDQHRQECTKYYIYETIARHFAGGDMGAARKRYG